MIINLKLILWYNIAKTQVLCYALLNLSLPVFPSQKTAAAAVWHNDAVLLLSVRWFGLGKDGEFWERHRPFISQTRSYLGCMVEEHCLLGDRPLKLSSRGWAKIHSFWEGGKVLNNQKQACCQVAGCCPDPIDMQFYFWIFWLAPVSRGIWH